MRPRLGTLAACLAIAVLGCRARTEPEAPLPKRVEPSAMTEPEHPSTPPRWIIDGGTLAEEPALPSALARALREAGYEASAVQDHVIVDLNGDGRRDALVLLVALGGPAPGGFEAVVLLSEGERVELRPLGPLIAANEATPWPIYALSVLPLVEGPTLIAAAPRPGPCDQGPQWSFVRVTGTLLESAGRVAIEPYDCALDHDEAALDFVRDASGQVEAIELRHRGEQTRLVWDSVHGSFGAQD